MELRLAGPKLSYVFRFVYDPYAVGYQSPRIGLLDTTPAEYSLQRFI